jgi:hypothetical protein
MSNLNEVAEPWPGDVDPDGPWGADAVLRWLASDGLSTSAVGVDLAGFDIGDMEARNRYFLNLHRMFHAHDTFIALSALREVDPAKADEVADQIVGAAVAGDSYGEWLWQWAVGVGLDAQAISDAAREAVRA